MTLRYDRLRSADRTLTCNEPRCRALDSYRSFRMDNLTSQRRIAQGERTASRFLTFEGKQLSLRREGTLEDRSSWPGSPTARRTAIECGKTLSRMFGFFDDFPLIQSTMSGPTLWPRVAQTKIYVVQTSARCRTLHPDGHRSRRPRPRSDLRLRHHRLCRRAMGPALDHHRHQPRRAGARSHAADGGALSLVSARRQPRRPRQGSGTDPARARRHAGPQRPPPRLRLRARAAHHPQVDRQQSADRRHLGEVAGGARAAARRAQRRARQDLRGMANSARPALRRARLQPRSPTPNGGRRASPVSGRSTPRSPRAPTSNISTTSPTSTMPASASPGRSRSRACRPIACCRRAKRN